MKNTELILMLVDKSTNAFGQIHGISEENKFKKISSIIQSTIQDTFNINSYYLSEKIIEDFIAKNQLNLEQMKDLATLLCTKAKILLELDQTNDSLTLYNSALKLLNWENSQPAERSKLERKNKISDLEIIISTLKTNNNIKILKCG